jgi:extradiol dioxygenase family protein
METSIAYPFHLAFPVHDLDKTEKFYVHGLGCTVGRRASRWIDFDLYGHQLSAHLRTQPSVDAVANSVDGDSVPIPHFGCVLTMDAWCSLRDRLSDYGVHFEIEPRIRFQGKPGEQATLFVRDPSGNALEFKAFADLSKLFAPQSA